MTIATPFPYAGITRIRSYEGMFSGRHLRHPQRNSVYAYIYSKFELRGQALSGMANQKLGAAIPYSGIIYILQIMIIYLYLI